MPHGGPHQTTTTFNRPKTDTRPKGMPSFLSYSKPKPKPKPFSQMTHQERTERFNKNQAKYKKQFEKKEGTIREKAQTNRYYADRYGYYQIPDGSKPKTKKQKSIDDRKLYRQYQDPKVLEATERAKLGKTQANNFIDDAIGAVADLPVSMYENYMDRVTNVNKHFSNLLSNAKKEYISPEEPYWQRMLKERALTEWYGTGAVLVGAMEGALGLTLDSAAGFTASTMANFNDIYRGFQGLPLDAKIHNDMVDDIQYHIVGATMAAWESTGYGAMKVPKYPRQKMIASANFIAKKIPFEFKNTIKVFKEMQQKKAKGPFNAKKGFVEGDFVMMTEAATKNPAVKKEIKQLAIQSWEQANAINYGPIMANNIANHLRQVNDIMPVQAQSVGAAATPKELLPAPGIKNPPKVTEKDVRPTLQQAPFYNGLEIAVDGINADANGAITLDQIKKVAQVKRFRKHLNVTGFGNKIAELDAQNINKVSKDSVLKYLKDNPFELQGQIAVASRGPIADNIARLENSISKTHDSIANIHREIIQSTLNPPATYVEGLGTSVHGYGMGARDEINELITNQYLNPVLLQYSSNNLMNKLGENRGVITQGDLQMPEPSITYNTFKNGDWKIYDWIPTGSSVNTQSQLRSINGKFADALYITGPIANKTIEAEFKNAQAWMKEYLNNVKRNETTATTDGKKGFILVTGLGNFKGTISTPTYEEFSLMAKAYREAVQDMANNLVPKTEGGTGARVTAIDEFENMVKTLMMNTFAKDLPEWKYYQNALSEIKDSAGFSFDGLQEKVTLEVGEKEILEMSPAYAKEKGTAVLGGESLGYTVEGKPKWQGQSTYDLYGKLEYGLKQDYFELYGTTNLLTNFPRYKDRHFSSSVKGSTVENLAFWQLINRREGTGNYKGRTILMAEEIQPTKPTEIQLDKRTGVEATGSPFYGSITKRPLFSVETLPDGTKVLQSKYDKIQVDLEQSPATSNFDWEKAEKPINLLRFKENADGSITVLGEFSRLKSMVSDTVFPALSSGDKAQDLQNYVDESIKFESYDDFITETEMAMDIPTSLIQKEMGVGSPTGGEANWLKKDLWMGITHAYNSGDAVYAWPTSKTIQKKKEGEPVTGASYDNSAKILESLGFTVKKIPLWDLGVMPPKDNMEFWGGNEPIIHPTEDGKFEIEITPDVKQWYIDRYGDFEAWGVDLDAPQKNNKETFEILDEGMDVGQLDLDGQTDQMLSKFV